MKSHSPQNLMGDKGQVPTEFDAVAKRYDLMVGLNPGYSRHLRLSAQRLGLHASARILDLCCGTGLSTEALAHTYPNAELIGLDGSAGMLEVARRKPSLARVSFLQGDAMAPRASGLQGHFDGILMAYGIRNMREPNECLRGVFELLAPGGTVCFHEYSVADSLVGRALWNAVAGGVIIPLGLVTSPGSNIYRYLRRSVNDFDGVRAFEARLRGAGFTTVRTISMDGWQKNVLHSFLAERPR